ncbi:MAG: YfhO family protein [Bacteroidales bacterium]|nr:YfhO family protein [Candidatus Cryptobacteroides aphodequi]
MKKYGAYLVAMLVFVALTLAYTAPQFSGRTLQQGDTNQWKGMSHQLVEYNKTAETPSAWAEAMFSGMPAYQIALRSPEKGIVKVVNAVDRFFKKLITFFFDDVRGLIMGYLIGFFIMFLAFGLGPWLSLTGALAAALSSYFLLIIPAGHQTKAMTLAFIAPVIGGFYLIFRRRKYALGAILVMLFSSAGLLRHPQMSYYMFMMLGLMGIAEIVMHIKEKALPKLALALGVFILAIGIGVGTGYHILKSNSEYVGETMRGSHSELTEAGEKAPAGLDIEYATAWSYGIDETLTLLVPNYMGGSSSYNVGRGSALYKSLVRVGVPAASARNIVAGAPTYWGQQPFTAGAVYVGAIVCLLFLFGCIVVKGPYKSALLAATLFSILLSWGHNFMPLTQFFFDHFPLYNKFRTVSSILVVAEVAMPLLGFLALRDLFEGRIERRAAFKALGISSAVLGGICLILALFGGAICSFSGYADQSFPEWFLGPVMAQRAAMLKADAWRSLAFVVLGAGLLCAFVAGKVKKVPFALALAALVMTDMIPVDLRFFGQDNWVTKRENDSFFQMRPYEKEILQDPGYFRCANLSVNTFNDARTSYYLNSIGGYHAAKLRRYQDLIDAHLSKGNMNVYNMLNTKYIIRSNESGGQSISLNPEALGPAWFVDGVSFVASPREESDALWTIDPERSAVADEYFSEFAIAPSPETPGSIELLSHRSDRLEYRTSCPCEKTAVFSEIYYPKGWNAYIDGQAVEHFRVDYVLRALNVPAGEHVIAFEFRPDSIYRGYKVSAAFKALMYLFILLFAFVKGRECLARRRV